MMKTRNKKRIAARVDGEERYGGNSADLLNDPANIAYRDSLLQLRAGAQAAARTPEISDGQFGAFMAGIQERMDAPAPGFRRWWAMASLSAAALVIALSLIAVFSNGTTPVRATEVESVTTDLQGATVDFTEQEQGVATIWVTMPEGDLW